jgi:hypothetical protein
MLQLPPGYESPMTTTPDETSPEPEVVPSGDPAPDSEPDPDTEPDIQPSSAHRLMHGEVRAA